MIRNETAVPVVLDSIRIASTELSEGDRYLGSIAAQYVLYAGGESQEGGFYCTPFSSGRLCAEWEPLLFGRALAPGDSVDFVSFEVRCDICLSGPNGSGPDTLRVYSGGIATPAEEQIPSGLFVASEAGPEASVLRLDVSPNPVRGVAMLTLARASDGSGAASARLVVVR